MACLASVFLGLFAFETKNCLDQYFVLDDAVCESCVISLGAECELCSNSTVCDTCATGYFFVTESNDVIIALGIDVATETKCRSCQDLFGPYCTLCDTTGCIESTADSYLVGGTVMVCGELHGLGCGTCSADGGCLTALSADTGFTSATTGALILCSNLHNANCLTCDDAVCLTSTDATTFITAGVVYDCTEKPNCAEDGCN